jgi:hypothetical protein
VVVGGAGIIARGRALRHTAAPFEHYEGIVASLHRLYILSQCFGDLYQRNSDPIYEQGSSGTYPQIPLN